MLIKTALLAAAVLAATPVQTAPEATAPQQDWQTLPPAAPAPISQEEADTLRKYIATLEQAYLRMQQQRDEARNRYLTCQGRGRT